MVYDQGYFLSDEEVKAAIVLLDKNGTGKIEYAEFKAWWAKEDRFQFLQIGEAKLKVIQQLTEYFKVRKSALRDDKVFVKLTPHTITFSLSTLIKTTPVLSTKRNFRTRLRTTRKQRRSKL